MLSNQVSNSGKKWAHFAILRVGWLAAADEKEVNGLRVAAVAANLTKSRRVVCRIRLRLMLKAISTQQTKYQNLVTWVCVLKLFVFR